MAKKTIHQVISEVLGAAGRPMTSREIYQAILEQSLYEFKAKDPANIVRNQLRRHCIDVTATRGASVKYFKMTDDGRFALLESPSAAT